MHYSQLFPVSPGRKSVTKSIAPGAKAGCSLSSMWPLLLYIKEVPNAHRLGALSVTPHVTKGAFVGQSGRTTGQDRLGPRLRYAMGGTTPSRPGTLRCHSLRRVAPSSGRRVAQRRCAERLPRSTPPPLGPGWAATHPGSGQMPRVATARSTSARSVGFD
jgi:hypothetical protein